MGCRERVAGQQQQQDKRFGVVPKCREHVACVCRSSHQCAMVCFVACKSQCMFTVSGRILVDRRVAADMHAQR